MKQLLELTDIEIRMGFAASCVETAAKQAGCSYLEMYRRMKRVGLINNYILRHYEVIHTESRENITANILETLSNWEAYQGITAPKGTNLYLQKQQGKGKATPADVSTIPPPGFICLATFILWMR